MTASRRTFLFVAYCACLALTHASVLRELLVYSRENVSSSHVLVIPLVSLVLIFQRRSLIFATVRTSWMAGIATVAAGCGLGVAARLSPAAAKPDQSLTWAVSALVVLLIGGFILLYGKRAFKAALFPLGFLIFMVPVPDVMLSRATFFLKQGSTETVAGLFSLTGTPYHRSGFVFTLPSLIIEIADECSGIRSSIALLLTMLLTGYVCLERPANRLLLVLAILPVAILKNAIRIVALSLLAIHVDRDFMVGRLHHEGGIVFFAGALLLLTPLVSVVRHSESRGAGTKQLSSAR